MSTARIARIDSASEEIELTLNSSNNMPTRDTLELSLTTRRVRRINLSSVRFVFPEIMKLFSEKLLISNTHVPL